MAFDIICLREKPDMSARAAKWFHEKWGIPEEAYAESMEMSLSREAPVPQWYAALEGDRIIGGLGVIGNDFHDRPDLSPNICAVYTEKDRRGLGIAGALLGFACKDMKDRGIDTLYLLTDHTGFYERYGWSFYCMAFGDGEDKPSRMYVHYAGAGVAE